MRLRGLAVCAIATALLAAGCGSSHRASSAPRLDAQLHAELPAAIQRSGILTVETDASYAPAESFAANGRTVIGFEPDLLAAMGRVLGVKVAITDHDFATLLNQVSAHRVDMVMSAMTDSRAREHFANFVDYFSAGASIVVQHGDPDRVTSLSSLCGRPVAVESGTTEVSELATASKQCSAHAIDVQQYSTDSSAMEQLRTGRVVAVLTDYPPAAQLVSAPATRPFYQLASDTQYDPGLYGIAVAKNDMGLAKAVSGALDELMRNGTYEAILKHWKVQSGAIAAVKLNLGAA